MNLYQNLLLRRVVLPLLKAFNRDIYFLILGQMKSLDFLFLSTKDIGFTEKIEKMMKCLLLAGLFNQEHALLRLEGT